MKTALRYIVLSLVFFAASGVQAQQPSRSMDELMRKSGLHNQLGSVFGNIRAQLAGERAQAPKGSPGDLDDATFEQLVRAMEKSFAVDHLRQYVAADLAKNLSPEDERAAIRWLDSDLGQRVTALEEARDATRGDQQARMREIAAYFEAAPKERKELGERMASALNAGESGFNQVVAMTTAVVYGMSLADPRLDESAVKKLKEVMEGQRPQAVAAFRQMSVLLHTHAYRDLPLADLTRYIEFIESPAGLRYHDATHVALVNAIARASVDLGRIFGESMPKSPKRS